MAPNLTSGRVREAMQLLPSYLIDLVGRVMMSEHVHSISMLGVLVAIYVLCYPCLLILLAFG